MKDGSITSKTSRVSQLTTIWTLWWTWGYALVGWIVLTRLLGLGWLIGANDIDGLSKGMEDSQPEILGNSNGSIVGTSEPVGVTLGLVND